MNCLLGGRKVLDESIHLTEYNSTQAHSMAVAVGTEHRIHLEQGAEQACSLCNFRPYVMAKVVRVDNASSGICSVFHAAKEILPGHQG